MSPDPEGGNIIQTFMYVLVTYKDEENQMKNEGARVVTTLYSYIFDAQMSCTSSVLDKNNSKVSKGLG